MAPFKRFLLGEKPEENKQKEGSRQDIKKPTGLFTGYVLNHDQDSGPEEDDAGNQDQDPEEIGGFYLHDSRSPMQVDKMKTRVEIFGKGRECWFIFTTILGINE
jgi:hypothetical protein